MLACDYVLFIVYESATRKKEWPVLGAFFLMCCTQSADRDYFSKSICHNTQKFSINFVKYDFRKYFI